MALITSCLLRRWRRLYSAWHCARSSVRQFCTADEEKYLELLQLKDIKSEEFYDLQAQKRRYFYYVDLQGRLFLENTRPKNIATSLKSTKFLRFFFSQVRPNGIAQSESTDEDAFLEYPFRSPCGKEINFIKCADRPFVFEDLRRDDSGNWMLIFGGGELMMPFLPETLRVSLMTGRLYHDVQTKYIARGTREGVALVKSQLAVELSKHMDFNDFPNGTDADVKSLQVGDFKWENQHYAIHTIE